MRRVSSGLLGLSIVLIIAISLFAQPQPRPDPLDPNHVHDRWETQPRDIIRDYRAYTTSFDGDDDNDGDGQSDLWGIPEWVSYEIDKAPEHAPYEDRPHPWLTDRDLYNQGTAPGDESYANSGFDRGHLCMREIARRLGKDADWNSHNVLNAVPQPHEFNAGLWLSLEKWTGIWANTYNKVWVICGPVVGDSAGIRQPTAWIGDGDEKKVAVPQKLFKIVVKESSNPNRPDVLAFIYPNDASLADSSLSADHTPYLVSVRNIEERTGLNFFSALSQADQDAIETQAATELWPGPEDTHPHNLRALSKSIRTQSLNLRMIAEIDRLYEQNVEQEREPRRVVTPAAIDDNCRPVNFSNCCKVARQLEVRSRHCRQR